MKEGRKPEYPEKTPDDELQKTAIPINNQQLTRARTHHKVVGNFRSEADVPSLYYRRFRFNETSDVGACTHGRPAK